MKDIFVKIHSTGETIMVSRVSYDEYRNLFGREAVVPLLVACGFATAYVTDVTLDKMRQKYAHDEVALSAMSNMVLGHNVTIMEDVSDQLSKENMKAIFLHEIGHIVAGHVKNVVVGTAAMQSFSIGETELLCDDDIEIEADAYAASFVGYHRVIAALNAVVKAMAGLAAARNTAGLPASYFEKGTMNTLRDTRRYQELLKYTEGY